MMNLNKMTARYIEHEDRIALLAENEKGAVVCMWLARPLTQRLVTSLVDLLKPETASDEHAEALESFKQAAAEQQHQPTAPVKSSNPDLRDPGDLPPAAEEQTADAPAGGAPRAYAEGRGADTTGMPAFKAEEVWLVREINIKKFDAGYVLTFQGRVEDFAAQSGMSEALLRQWLGILRRLCLTAGWTAADWPDWMKREGMFEQAGALPN
jgi:hypothetical protein